eukprot:CAMPEP_0118708932 /NCGR_PEP_ID=MMETSP0800-20121206/22263_1 /TAXON_ID=210618 ORGANISM="Striatella unipunctata, Strain CCMP2910" /NCGR_SAMPLE_ID=MMETSP0800 /ASSEMBLY_ACC=CAM_ASM_000638 /LENGTH=309 /DNA_ID=CAMNT_0006612383 /DNA_START=57 /DNA_END=986 /DNA_ORIENTATION=-
MILQRANILLGLIIAIFTTEVSHSFPLEIDWGSIIGTGLIRHRCTGIVPLLARAFVPSELRVDWSLLVEEQSVLQVADAGSYYGPDGIQEYSDFITILNPYIADAKSVKVAFKFTGFDETNNLCNFIIPAISHLVWDPSTTRYGAEFNFGAMVKLEFNPDTRIVTRINAYTKPSFINLIYGVLMNSDNTREYICSVLSGSCENTEAANDMTGCMSELAALPVFTGDLPWIDGKSQSCRALHATFAEYNPDEHCAHIQFNRTADPKGVVKCQDSDWVLPSELFDDEDFEYFDSFLEKHGIDPELGHDEES